MTSFSAEQRVRAPLLTAGWLEQSFVHWPYPPDQVQALLPDGLTADVLDGAAWVGFTPFVMASVKLAGAVPLPNREFPEANLRTYVRLPGGEDGIWFLSIEVGNPLLLAARAIGVPYHVARLRVGREGRVVRYAGERRGGGGGRGPAYRLAVEVSAPVEAATERDVWLTSRWRCFTRRAGVILATPVEHEPWPLARATVLDLREDLTAHAGLAAPVGDPVAHFSPGVRRVRLGVPRRARLHGAG
ncbi:YqjF family protein [Streptomyces sp. URMC 123]|uniref:YqjF family protein n=1 Tax=Streptomyces sp. URMC 123 TaxID=3423403 RepID=UPI003F1D6CAD